MTNQPQHNIKIIRLQNGEDIISDCVISEDDYLVQLNNPMTLLFKRGAKGTVMMMVPWLPLEVICDNIATITQDDILTFVEPKEDLIEYYGNMVEIAIESISKNDSVLANVKEELHILRDEALAELEPDIDEAKIRNIMDEIDTQRRKKLH
jgi:hypothetical protein